MRSSSVVRTDDSQAKAIGGSNAPAERSPGSGNKRSELIVVPHGPKERLPGSFNKTVQYRLDKQ